MKELAGFVILVGAMYSQNSFADYVPPLRCFDSSVCLKYSSECLVGDSGYTFSIATQFKKEVTCITHDGTQSKAIEMGPVSIETFGDKMNCGNKLIQLRGAYSACQ